MIVRVLRLVGLVMIVASLFIMSISLFVPWAKNSHTSGSYLTSHLHYHGHCNEGGLDYCRYTTYSKDSTMNGFKYDFQQNTFTSIYAFSWIFLLVVLFMIGFYAIFLFNDSNVVSRLTKIMPYAKWAMIGFFIFGLISFLLPILGLVGSVTVGFEDKDVQNEYSRHPSYGFYLSLINSLLLTIAPIFGFLGFRNDN